MDNNYLNEKIQELQENSYKLLEKFNHLLFSNQKNNKLFEKHCQKTFLWLHYLMFFLKGITDEFIKNYQIFLPEKNNLKKKTLFLDLDETLIHRCEQSKIPQIRINKKFGINIRPYCKEFLKTISKTYEIFIFTASKLHYAQKIIETIDPYYDYIEGILDKRKCLKTQNGILLKDLRMINNRKLKDMIIVDNSAYTFGYSIENGIPILPFYDDPNDKELLFLINYLESAAEWNDVREFNSKELSLKNIMNELLF